MLVFCSAGLQAQNMLLKADQEKMKEWVDEQMEKLTPEQRLGQLVIPLYYMPNATEANLNINLGSGSNFDVTIIDQSGRTIHRSKLQTAGQIVYTINASRLATGIYNIVFSNGDTRIVRRLIVK